MKSVSLTYLVLLISFLMHSFLNGQRTPVKLKLIDGTTRVGLGKLKEKEIKFRTDKKTRPQYFLFEDLDEIIIQEGSKRVKYKSVRIENSEKPIMLQLITEGKVNLYQKSSFGYMPTGPSGVGSTGGTSFGGGQFYAVNNYYLKRKSQVNALHMGSNQLFAKNFKKAASNYFKDCTALVDKIQIGEYKKKHLKEIVTYYNNECN